MTGIRPLDPPGWVEASWLLVFVFQGLVAKRMARFGDADQVEQPAS